MPRAYLQKYAPYLSRLLRGVHKFIMHYYLLFTLKGTTFAFISVCVKRGGGEKFKDEMSVHRHFDQNMGVALLSSTFIASPER